MDRQREMAEVERSFDVTQDDQVILICDNSQDDGAFVIPYLVKQFLKQQIVFVNTQFTLGQYHMLGQFLDYEFAAQLAENVHVIDQMGMIGDRLINKDVDFFANTEQTLSILYDKIIERINHANNEKIYIIFDDLSHLLSLNIKFGDVLEFISKLMRLTSNSNVYFILRVHVSGDSDMKLANAIAYNANVQIQFDLSIGKMRYENAGTMTVIKHEQNYCKKYRYNIDYSRVTVKQIFT